MNLSEEFLVFTNFSTVTFQANKTISPTYHYYGLPVVVVLSAVLSVTMVASLIGNTLVILTILRNKDMRTRTNLLLCNLALADISVALLDIPVALYTIIMGDWNFSKTFCDFNGYLVGLGFMLSIHTLMWISIHKYISITKPFARVMTPRRIFCMMVAAWGWSLLYNVGPLVGWTDTEYKAGASQCGPVIPATVLQLSHSITNTTFNFVIPICVMSYCYYRIFAEVRQHMNRLQEFEDSRVRFTIVQQRRISITLFIVLLCFVLCWCPYICYSCTLVAIGKERMKPIFNPLAYLAAYINSACNPVIYALRSPSFRKAFQEIILGSKPITDASKCEHTFKWTRINGIVVSFRQSKKTHQKGVLGQKATKEKADNIVNEDQESGDEVAPDHAAKSVDPLKNETNQPTFSIGDDESDFTSSPLLDEREREMFFPKMVQGEFTSDLDQSQEVPRYPRSSSAEFYHSKKQPPHLVWKASVDKITFVPSGETKDEPTETLVIYNLITTVKRSFGDLFRATTDEGERPEDPCYSESQHSLPKMGSKNLE